jgi:hypothetical protein
LIRCLLLCLACLLTHTAAAEPPRPEEGEAIFRAGLLPSGKPLLGEREAGIRVEGTAAACAACHRRSGLGTAEGAIAIPAISAKYLFRPGGNRIEDVDYLRRAQGFKVGREPYSEESLARAIREGVGRDGRRLNYLMPRFPLDERAMAALIAYLRNLGTSATPGVTDDTLHFATVIAPDADPIKRRGMLDVLERFFADKNDFLRGGARPMQSSRAVGYRVTRKWQLHVWELSGAPETWQEQLRLRLAAEPVFALISGLAGKTWEPVQSFCEAQAIPCLLPNVDLPPVVQPEYYSLYFSRGVLLEAELFARQLRERRDSSGLKRLVQVFRAGDIGESAAAALRAAAGLGLATLDHVVSGADARPELADIARNARPGDVLVLWLRAEDLRQLPSDAGDATAVFASGLMGGMEKAPVPTAWHSIVRLSNPFDLPELRRVRMNYPLGWFKVRNIAVVDERVQSDTYLACGILAENLTDMLDSFVRDYLIERVEGMLSRRTISGYYPRLGLAPGQRFASKGGYIVRFAEPEGSKVVADSDWIVP